MPHEIVELAQGGTLLVGSVPLRSAPEVFRTVSFALGDRLQRLPDGETGPRADWIRWQYPVLRSRPQLEVCPPGDHPYRFLPRLRLAAGASADALRVDDLGYAEAALASYRVFATFKREGLIPARCRFQVSLPTPLSPISAFVAPEDQAVIEPVYEAALLADVHAILDVIPHDQLAIQWDTNFEFAMIDDLLPAWFPDVRTGIVERLLRLAREVPEGVELGYHFCQDHERRHHDRPYDARGMVQVANALSATVSRPLDWLHLPVPAERLDIGFFEKLAPLTLRPETELYLGLIHLAEGVVGVSARLTAAQRYLERFGVATACGWGRHRPQDVYPLLALHVACSASPFGPSRTSPPLARIGARS